MVDPLAVGGSVPPVGSAGWDAWPLVGLALVLWIGRRLLRLPWRAPLLIAGLAGALGFPPAVNAWGIVPACAVVVAVGLVAWATVATADGGRRPSV